MGSFLGRSNRSRRRVDVQAVRVLLRGASASFCSLDALSPASSLFLVVLRLPDGISLEKMRPLASGGLVLPQLEQDARTIPTASCANVTVFGPSGLPSIRRTSSHTSRMAVARADAFQEVPRVARVVSIVDRGSSRGRNVVAQHAENDAHVAVDCSRRPCQMSERASNRSPRRTRRPSPIGGRVGPIAPRPRRSPARGSGGRQSASRGRCREKTERAASSPHGRRGRLSRDVESATSLESGGARTARRASAPRAAKRQGTFSSSRPGRASIAGSSSGEDISPPRRALVGSGPCSYRCPERLGLVVSRHRLLLRLSHQRRVGGDGAELPAPASAAPEALIADGGRVIQPERRQPMAVDAVEIHVFGRSEWVRAASAFARKRTPNSSFRQDRAREEREAF